MQRAALKSAGCKKTFTDDGLSGATIKRPALLRCLKTLKAGDTLIVWKLDRLGRSLRDLITMLDDLKKQGVKFRSLTEHIDTDTPTGRAMWQMIGVLAELERSLITERTRAGVKAAKNRGVKFGRKPKLTRQQINQAVKLISQGELRIPPKANADSEVNANGGRCRQLPRRPHHPLPGALRLNLRGPRGRGWFCKVIRVVLSPSACLCLRDELLKNRDGRNSSLPSRGLK
ncbi:MAG: recombinase family protein [Bryobacteraceae bacterium]